MGALFYNASIGVCSGLIIGMYGGWFIDHKIFIKSFNESVFIECDNEKSTRENMWGFEHIGQKFKLHRICNNPFQLKNHSVRGGF